MEKDEYVRKTDVRSRVCVRLVRSIIASAGRRADSSTVIDLITRVHIATYLQQILRPRLLARTWPSRRRLARRRRLVCYFRERLCAGSAGTRYRGTYMRWYWDETNRVPLRENRRQNRFEVTEYIVQTTIWTYEFRLGGLGRKLKTSSAQKHIAFRTYTTGYYILYSRSIPVRQEWPSSLSITIWGCPRIFPTSMRIVDYLQYRVVLHQLATAKQFLCRKTSSNPNATSRTSKHRRNSEVA